MAIVEVGQVPSDYETFDVIPDSIYGSGMDGNVTISSNTTLSRDMHYNNLTIDPGIVLDTAGYRVFVRNVLAMAVSSSNQSDTKIGRVGGVSTSGTLRGGAIAAVTNSLGGNGNGYTATAPTVGLSILIIQILQSRELSFMVVRQHLQLYKVVQVIMSIMVVEL